VTFTDPLVALAALSAGWAFITPVLVALATRLDGYAATASDVSDHPSGPGVLDDRLSKASSHV
jgi:hypothetical protein